MFMMSIDTFNSKNKWAHRQNKSPRSDFCLPETPACQIKLFRDHQRQNSKRS